MVTIISNVVSSLLAGEETHVIDRHSLRLAVLRKKNGVFQDLQGLAYRGLEPGCVDGATHGLQTVEERNPDLIVDPGRDSLHPTAAREASVRGQFLIQISCKLGLYEKLTE